MIPRRDLKALGYRVNTTHTRGGKLYAFVLDEQNYGGFRDTAAYAWRDAAAHRETWLERHGWFFRANYLAAGGRSAELTGLVSDGAAKGHAEARAAVLARSPRAQKIDIRLTAPQEGQAHD